MSACLSDVSFGITEYTLILGRVGGKRVPKLWILATNNENSIHKKILKLSCFFSSAQRWYQIFPWPYVNIKSKSSMCLVFYYLVSLGHLLLHKTTPEVVASNNNKSLSLLRNLGTNWAQLGSSHPRSSISCNQSVTGAKI